MLTSDEYICNLKRHGITTTIPDEPYKGVNTSIYHFCKVHNYRFKAQPSNIMNGYPCPLCNKEKNRITNETNYKQKLLDKNIPVLLDDKYISHSEKVYHICIRCNNRWKTSPTYVLKNKYPCPKCAKKETAKIRTKTHEEFQNEVHKILGDSISITGNYRGVKNIINVHCNVCNYDWTPLAESLLSGHSCPKCRDIETGNRHRKTIDQYKEEVSVLYKDIVVISDKYKNSNTPILHQCTSCLYTYYQTPSNVLNGHGKCPLCNKCYEISGNEFIELLSRKGKQIKLLSSYTGKGNNIDCQCLICNYVWTSVASSLLNTVFNCPNCAINDRKKLLISNNEFVERVHEQFPNIELLHEYKGSYNSMDCYCNICNYNWTVKHSYKLYYSGCPNCAGNIRKTHEQFLSDISDNLDPTIEIIGTYNGANNIIECRCKKCKSTIMTTPTTLKSGSGCKKCKDRENGLQRRKSHDQFISEISIVNQDIKILGQYNGADSYIQTKCLLCGHIWSPRAGSLLRGTGCPKCANNYTISHEEFIKKIETTKNKNLQLIGTYINATTPIECKCTICGDSFFKIPYLIEKGTGCKKCTDKASAKMRQKTHEKFIEEIRNIHDNKIKVLSEYNGSNDKVQCKCIICGHLWQAIPSSLIYRKTGCPICTSSKNERTVQTYLDKYNISYIHPAKFNKLFGIGGRHLSYDFYLPTYNLLIECQGAQHERPVDYFGGMKKFVTQIIHDIRKRKYAHEHNIHLLEIWYYEINKTEKILEQTLNNLKSESLTTAG